MIIVLIAHSELANAVYSATKQLHHGVVALTALKGSMSVQQRMNVIDQVNSSANEYYINLVVNPRSHDELALLRQKGAQVVHQYELVSTYKNLNVVRGEHMASNQKGSKPGHVLAAKEVLSECLAMHRKRFKAR